MTEFVNVQDPVDLISSAQNLTGSWVDLGSEIKTEAQKTLAVFAVLDINDSLNARVRFLGKHASAHADEFTLPIRTISSSDVKLEPEYLELNTDADQKMILSVELYKVVPYVQVQVQAGTVGASAGQIDSAVYTMAY